MNMLDFFNGLQDVLAEEVPGAVLTIEPQNPAKEVVMPTTDEIVKQMKAEILSDVANKVVPPDVPDFAALHDYVDANYYGGAFAIYDLLVTASQTDDEHVAKLNAVSDMLNPAIEIVNAWIKAGGINAKPESSNP